MPCLLYHVKIVLETYKTLIQGVFDYDTQNHNSTFKRTYAYQIFSGLKTAPKRDKLICLSIGMGLSVNETNSVLKIAGLSPLYPKIKRDSIIIINMNNNKSVVEINEALYNEGEDTLN